MTYYESMVVLKRYLLARILFALRVLPIILLFILHTKRITMSVFWYFNWHAFDAKYIIFIIVLVMLFTAMWRAPKHAAGDWVIQVDIY